MTLFLMYKAAESIFTFAASIRISLNIKNQFLCKVVKPQQCFSLILRQMLKCFQDFSLDK